MIAIYLITKLIIIIITFMVSMFLIRMINYLILRNDFKTIVKGYVIYYAKIENNGYILVL